jgi:hypothetical protein
MVAAATSDYYWPDGVDWAVRASYLALIFGVIAAGYICMALRRLGSASFCHAAANSIFRVKNRSFWHTPSAGRTVNHGLPCAEMGQKCSLIGHVARIRRARSDHLWGGAGIARSGSAVREREAGKPSNFSNNKRCRNAAWGRV